MSNIHVVPDRHETLNAEVPAEDAKKITIIGAGIAGLAAACELEQLGHHVEVLEAL